MHALTHKYTHMCLLDTHTHTHTPRKQNIARAYTEYACVNRTHLLPWQPFSMSFTCQATSAATGSIVRAPASMVPISPPLSPPPAAPPARPTRCCPSLSHVGLVSPALIAPQTTAVDPHTRKKKEKEKKEKGKCSVMLKQLFYDLYEKENKRKG